MSYMDTLIIAVPLIALGWLTGRLIHNFVTFVMEAANKNERDN